MQANSIAVLVKQLRNLFLSQPDGFMAKAYFERCCAFGTLVDYDVVGVIGCHGDSSVYKKRIKTGQIYFPR
jgi:hypothetical protein